MNHKQDQPQPAADEMSLMDHLGELRRRLVISFAAVFLLSCLAYVFSNPIFDILTKPYFDSFGDNLLIGTGPAEAFLTKLKVSFFSGIVLA
ncbi:MAG: twin-arginine translocase subunit TatC, partial [Proteobacteria bacterium]